MLFAYRGLWRSYGKPVARRDLSSWEVLETRMRFSLRYAPSPSLAQNVSPRPGISTTPIIGFPFLTMAMEIPKIGTPWAKFVVPSIGSIIHLNSPSPSIFASSSDMIVWLGKFWRIFLTMSSLQALSASVTRSKWLLFVEILKPFSWYFKASFPASWASFLAIWSRWVGMFFG